MSDREGDTVTFTGGTTMSVFDIAREWAEWQDRLHGDRCINPDCDRPATMNLTVFGQHAGRVCDTCAEAHPVGDDQP